MTLRVALLGTGFWARRAHVPALRALPDVELVACVGATLDESETFAKDEGIPAAYATLEQLLDEAAPQVVAIVAPDDVHAPAATAALERGVAVFCEKPLANDVASASTLTALERTASAPATVGFSFRFSPALQAMRRDLDSGVLGEPWFVELYEHNPQFHPARGIEMNWKGDPSHAAAGALFEYGSHVVDLARWLVGDVSGVSTSFGYVRPNARLDDIATLQLRFEKRAVGILVASWVLAGGFPGIRVRLHGSDALGEAILDQSAVGGERYVRIGDNGAVREEVQLEPLRDGVASYTLRHYEALVAAVLGERAADLPTFADGLATQVVLEAALRANERWADVLSGAV